MAEHRFSACGHVWQGVGTIPLKCPVCGQPDLAALPTIAPPPEQAGAATEAGTWPETVHADQPAGNRIAARVPGYEILEELGRGGMGVVYKARQTRLARIVALKMILSGEHAGGADLRRFRAEAHAVARLSHPNIVQIHDVGEADCCPFLSLEFVGGGSLDRKLRSGPLPAEEAAALTETLARAMQHAHQKGVIHRDLKPANVLLTEDGTPKITDFGIAKHLADAGVAPEAGDRPAGQTATGAIMGTPGYMAPEQAGGHTREIGPAADVYALGAILYECLTGRPPFQADSAVNTILQVVSDEPTPPHRLRPDVPADLETICLKCLEKAPRRRYALAGDLADDLRRYLDGEPILARPPGPLGRLLRWATRQPALAATLAALAVFYLNHLFIMGVLKVNLGWGFHWFVTALALVWAATAAGFQRLVHVRGWEEVGVYLWAGADVALFTLLLWRADGPTSALLVGYLVLTASAGLRFRIPLVWFVAGLCAAGFLGLEAHAVAFRPDKAAQAYRSFIFLLMLGMMGLIQHLLLKRVRAQGPA
jgi:serine/threonine-protein kinase